MINYDICKRQTGQIPTSRLSFLYNTKPHKLNKQHFNHEFTMTYTIALVEDDELLRGNYTKALERDGYHVNSYASRTEAAKAFANKLPDLAILDIMLGQELEGGFELCRQLRQQSSTVPIIFLTARDSDIDRVSGLRLGAWDYLLKNSTTLDFLPVRINALFKIIETLGLPDNSDKNSTIEVGVLKIDTNRKQVFWQGQLVDLTLTEYWLLCALAKNPGHVKSHDQLMAAANVVVTNNAITAHIRRIRDKFREFDSDFNNIRTEYGMGYRYLVD